MNYKDNLYREILDLITLFETKTLHMDAHTDMIFYVYIDICQSFVDIIS